MTILITFAILALVLALVIIEELRRILDALHTIAAQGASRRRWEKVEESK